LSVSPSRVTTAFVRARASASCGCWRGGVPLLGHDQPTIFECTCLKPLGDQPNDPSIAEAMFDEPDQPILANLVENRLNVATPQSVSQCRFPFVRHTAPTRSLKSLKISAR
jgi:hypothetical protein